MCGVKLNSMKKTGEPLTLTELIERLQELANVKGDYDSRVHH